VSASDEAAIRFIGAPQYMHCPRVGGFARRQSPQVTISSGVNFRSGASAAVSGTNHDSSISGTAMSPWRLYDAPRRPRHFLLEVF
jgi:hypothetical protein